MLKEETKKKLIPFCVIFGGLALLIICIVVGVHDIKGDEKDTTSKTNRVNVQKSESPVVVMPILGEVTLAELQSKYNEAKQVNPDVDSLTLIENLVPQVNVVSEGTEFNKSEIEEIRSKFTDIVIPDYFSGNFNINASKDVPFVENLTSLKSLETFRDANAGKAGRFFLKDAYLEEALSENLLKFSFNDGSSVVYIYFITDCEWEYIHSGSSFKVGETYDGDITLSSSLFRCEYSGDKEYMYAYFVGGLNASVYD